MRVSQPVLPIWQCAKPMSQAKVQAPLAQVGRAFCVLQATPQALQFITSVIGLAHWPLQHRVSPAPQA